MCAAQEQQKLESEIEATNVALKQLEQDALVVMEQQEQLEAQVTEKQAAAQEAKEKKEEKQKHVRVTVKHGCKGGRVCHGCLLLIKGTA